MAEVGRCRTGLGKVEAGCGLKFCGRVHGLVLHEGLCGQRAQDLRYTWDWQDSKVKGGP